MKYFMNSFFFLTKIIQLQKSKTKLIFGKLI